MPTTFRFSDAQLAELTQLRSQAEVSNQYFPVYQYILDVLDPPGPNLTKPRDQADVGLSYSWFVGARQVNEGVGPFATLVIEYTQRQGHRMCRRKEAHQSSNANDALRSSAHPMALIIEYTQ